MAHDFYPGELGFVSGSVWEAIHADWPAYPGDRSWESALLRLGDFPFGTEFRCIDVIDQVVLFMAAVGIRETDVFSDKHMHVAVRLEELLKLDEKGLVSGVELETEISSSRIHRKRTLGPDLWDTVASGQVLYTQLRDGRMIPLDESEDDEYWDDSSLRGPERVAMYHGTVVKLTSAALSEVERLAKIDLEIPSSLQARLGVMLNAELFDSAIRDLGVALETRMRVITGTNDYGARLIEQYIEALMVSGKYLPARLKTLRQELRSVFKFVRNEFAHHLIDLEPSRGYALASRLCWHVTDVELVIQRR